MTYTELQSDIVRVGSALWRLGIRKEDVVTLCCENIPEFLVMYLSLAAVGAVISCVSPAYTSGELALALTHAKSKMLVASAATIELAKHAANVAKLSHQDIVVFGEAAGCRPFSTLQQDDGKCFPENLDWEPQKDVVAVPFSSGTTGLPKGVILTHYNLVANVDQTRADDVLGYGSRRGRIDGSPALVSHLRSDRGCSGVSQSRSVGRVNAQVLAGNVPQTHQGL